MRRRRCLGHSVSSNKELWSLAPGTISNVSLFRTFRSELKKTKTPQSKEPTVADYPIDPIIEALSMNHHWGVPFALIVDEKFGVLPFSLEGPFTVLGWYHVCGVGEVRAFYNDLVWPVGTRN